MFKRGLVSLFALTLGVIAGVATSGVWYESHPANTVRIGDSLSSDKSLEFMQGASGNPYIKWDSGNSAMVFSNDGVSEQAIGSGAGGGLNYVKNADAEIDIGDVTVTDITLARDTSTPLVGAGSFELTSTATDGTADWDLNTIDNFYLDKPWLQVSALLQSDADLGDFTIGIYNVTDAQYVSDWQSITTTDVPGTSVNWTWLTQFTPVTGKVYVIRVETTSSTASDVLLADTVRVGPFESDFGNGYVGTNWEDFTPSWVNDTAIGFSYQITKIRQDGSDLLIDLTATATGNGTDALSIRLDMPNGLSSRETSGEYSSLSARFLDSSASAWEDLTVSQESATLMLFTKANNNGTLRGTDFDTGDKVILNSVRIPISGWGGGTTNTQTQVDYAYNSGTWNTDDTTSFAYGAGGAQITGALTANRAMRVSFQNPPTETETIKLQFKLDSAGDWFDAPSAAYPPLIKQNTLRYGAGLNHVNPTEIDVLFGQYRAPATGASYGGAGDAWATGVSWRVVKHKDVALTGVLPAQNNNHGLVKEDQGSFTANWVAGGNVDTVTEVFSNYFKTGNLVTVYMQVNIDPTATGTVNTNFPHADLPFTSIGGYALSGLVYRLGNPSNKGTVFSVSSDVRSEGETTTTGASDWSVTFTYITDE